MKLGTDKTSQTISIGVGDGRGFGFGTNITMTENMHYGKTCINFEFMTEWSLANGINLNGGGQGVGIGYGVGFPNVNECEHMGVKMPHKKDKLLACPEIIIAKAHS